MSVPERLAAREGRWTGRSTLQDPSVNAPSESPSTAVVTPVLGGRFLRIDYTWEYRGNPQEGSILIGGEPNTGEATAHWIDTWHMSDQVMDCRGTAGGDGRIALIGSYAAPPGPDWGWRIEVLPGERDTLALVMFNIWPDGREELAVEASYARAEAGETATRDDSTGGAGRVRR